jgi:hypothetical protein
MEVWLAGAPVLEIRIMLSSLAGNPELQTLIEECWSKRGNERRYTVPPKIKRKLCRLAIAHMTELRRDEIQRQRAQAAERRLRAAGYADAQIAEILSRTTPEHIAFKAPNLEKAIEDREPARPRGHATAKGRSSKITHINSFSIFPLTEQVYGYPTCDNVEA